MTSRAVGSTFIDAVLGLRPAGDAVQFSDRERSVLCHLASGMTREQVAQAEAIGVRTLDRVLRELQAKLDAPTPFVLGMRASRYGLTAGLGGEISPPEWRVFLLWRITCLCIVPMRVNTQRRQERCAEGAFLAPLPFGLCTEWSGQARRQAALTGRNMEGYLVYDAGYSVCTHLAELVRTAAPSKLSAISINDDAARHLLDQAYPHGWIRAPYLVVVRGEQVHAGTGLGAAARLAALMGPRKAWKVWREARRAGVTVPSGAPPLIVKLASRRQLLQISAGVAGAAGMAGLQQKLSPASVGAQPAPCQFPTCDYQYFTCDGYCQSMPTRADWRTNWYFCYDGPYYCGWRATNDGCRCYR